MRKEENFKPFPWMESSLTQTIVGSYLNFHYVTGSVCEYVNLPDNDIMAMQITTPKGWKETDLTVVFLHGLCGSEKSPYLVRMTNRVIQHGIRSVRLNMRGCGSGKGLAKNIYHCGSSDDIYHVIKQIKSKTPKSPIILIGFSLGGHIVLKLSGELKENAKEYLDAVVAISPPVNLLSSVRLISHPDNRLFEQYFAKLLIDNVKYIQKKFPEIEKFDFPEEMGLLEFDEYFVAPRIGYKSAFEYYQACSSLPLLPDITIPGKILFAKDDPIINPHDIEQVKLPSTLDVLHTGQGGHLGFLGLPSKEHGFRWMDGVLMNWILDYWNQIRVKNG
jgi:predicted alpha/beta-fold hydrolase